MFINYEYTWGSVTVKLGEAYGFCWGVERVVQIAYEARKQFPDEKIWITNEIIHKLTVNKRLEEMEVKDIPIEEGEKNLMSLVKAMLEISIEDTDVEVWITLYITEGKHDELESPTRRVGTEIVA
uniref:4-hydroxy-3-methylbut-2-enyl diphosphate reductase n=1 Tax=Lactuca sativa TaxID=4236 RepID=A0A9R1VQL7_LACSA|nr:hypothetical protein LSAT_V11C400159710 [Lactuca sativa]